MDKYFRVVPCTRAEAKRLCLMHPHAGTLPNSSKYYMQLKIGKRTAGLAVWGYGIVPKLTPKHLFGKAGHIEDYLELCRFFVYDWTPKNTASKFLSITHRIIKKYVPGIKWLYTYAAGFQGLLGYIYKAANYDYIGRTLCQGFLYIPGKGLVHNIALWHRYSTHNIKDIAKFIPNIKRWKGYNFRYIYWLCSKNEKEELLKNAKFEILPYPVEDDMEIWIEGLDGKKRSITKSFAKKVPIIKLRSNRGNK